MLKNAPMFKKQAKLGASGRGKSTILRAQAASKSMGRTIPTPTAGAGYKK